MTTVDQVLDRARSQIGVTEHPRGSNRTPYGAWYGIQGQPGCAMFVSWCTYHEGLALPTTISKGFAYTPAGLQEGQADKEGRQGDGPLMADETILRLKAVALLMSYGC